MYEPDHKKKLLWLWREDDYTCLYIYIYLLWCPVGMQGHAEIAVQDGGRRVYPDSSSEMIRRQLEFLLSVEDASEPVPRVVMPRV